MALDLLLCVVGLGLLLAGGDLLVRGASSLARSLGVLRLDPRAQVTSLKGLHVAFEDF